MAQSLANYWIALRLQAGLGALWAAYKDSSGHSLAPPRELSDQVEGWSPRALTLGLLPLPQWDNDPQRLLPDGVYLPSDFDERLRSMLEAMPGIRYGPHTTGPIPLPIFVTGPDGVQVFDWEQSIDALLPPDIDRDRIQIVRQARQTWTARPPFRLPIRILGAGVHALQGLDRLRSSSWYQKSPEVQQYGLHLDDVEPAELPVSLRGAPYDIVLVDQGGIQAALRSARYLPRPKETRPRLIVFLDDEANGFFLASLALPPGMSLLWAPLLPFGDAGPVVMELILGLIHDYPLHEAARSVMRQAPYELTGPVVLIADPLSNHDLRMADALEQLRREAFEVGALIKSGDVDSFLARISPAAVEPLAPYLKTATEYDALASEALDFSQRAQVDFAQESYGLAPMAEAEARIADAREARDSMAGSLESIAAHAEMASFVEATQERRVEMTMDRLDSSAIYRPLDPDFDALMLGSIFRLNVYVGHRLPNSLMVGEPPPLDPLLPEPEGESGHTLEVAVFEKDFELLSPRVQSLYLPRLGGSRPVAIECRAPDEAGPAELRVSIYYQNYLLQSFLMTAQVQADYQYSEERQISVQLDFSRTARFTNLPELAPRLLSIGSNQDGDGRTHSFMLKKDETATQPIRMTEALASAQISRFRDLIEAAATDIAHFAPDLSGRVPGVEDQQAFEAVIRDLAALGRELYRFLFDNSPREMRSQLRQVSKASDEIIQITRHDPGFSFPWPVIYDYRLPKEVLGALPARVCMGRPFSSTPDPRRSKSGKGCPHNPDEEVYCVEGFWGIRHRLEQLIEQGDALRDAVSVIVRPQARAGVCLATGVGGRFTEALATSLQQELQDGFVTLRTRDELFDQLWEPEQRPAICILLSHLETEDKDREPVGPRMLLSPPPEGNGGEATPLEAWLQPGDITDQSIDLGEWDEQPRTLVLLMACESAANAVDTLNNYLTSLTSAGAGAIVGTETSVFSDLVSLFAEEVTLSLWQGNTTLGEIIQSFNQRMIASYNPLAFVFNCFGSADIRLAV